MFLCHAINSPEHWVHKDCTTSKVKDHQVHHSTWTCPLHTNTNTATASVVPIPSQTNYSTPPSSNNPNSPTLPQPNLFAYTPSSKQQTLNIANKPQNRNLKILQLNINGIRNKITELKLLLTEENIDVAVIQETRLHPSIKTPEIKDYASARQDRQTQTSTKSKLVGGGLIIYVKNDIPFKNIASYLLPNIETQTIKIYLSKTKDLTITNIYIPQRNASTNLQTEDANITTLFGRLTNIPDSLIVGDVNAHSQLWHSPTPDHRGDVIASILQGSTHVILNQDTHTHVHSRTIRNNSLPLTYTILSVSFSPYHSVRYYFVYSYHFVHYHFVL